MTPQTIIVDSEERRARAIKVIGLLNIEQPIDVLISRHVEKRSESQNARLWKLHTLAADHVGCSAADMHEDMLCEHFGFTEVKMPSGSIHRIPLKRSSQRDKVEFGKFMEFVETFYITNLGVWLE